jgi:hypothetical protein
VALEAQHGQRLGEPFTQRRSRAGVGAVQLTGEGLELGLGGQCGLGVVGLPHPLGYGDGEVVGQPVSDIAQLVQFMPMSA